MIDLTTVVMGPSATQILGDLGADVIKVESDGGNSMRWVGPNRTDGMGPLYLNANRNKRSVVLDLKDAEDRDALLSLLPIGRCVRLQHAAAGDGAARPGL